MADVRYQVRPRSSNGREVWEIIRKGKQGGSRVMGTWTNDVAARRVCVALGLYAGEEV